MCEFCKRFDFGAASYEVGQTLFWLVGVIAFRLNGSLIFALVVGHVVRRHWH